MIQIISLMFFKQFFLSPYLFDRDLYLTPDSVHTKFVNLF